MQFTTSIYFLFFLIVYLCYWLIFPKKCKRYILLISSLLFYGSWSLFFLFHFIGIIIINYLLYLRLSASKNIWLLRIAVIFNLLNLLFFKYFYFFKLDKIFWFDVVLPLAISFYTFQFISFFVDSYKEKFETISFLEFVLFFTFFPQLIAGPILRAGDFLFQLKKEIFPKSDDFLSGLFFILIGITKKILIADNISRIIDPVWLNPNLYSSSAVFFSFFGFSWQIYCDFSGYSDIAIGSAFLLGYKLPRNFLGPFFSVTFQDLWRRWHITLSNWLGDYVYKSLGGNKGNNLSTYRNLLITFILGGFWHGASLNYIFWGGFCGSILIIERIIYTTINFEKIYNKIIFTLITYCLFVIGLIFFRTENLELLPMYFMKFFYLETGSSIIDIKSLLGFITLGTILQTLELFEIDSIVRNKFFKYLLILGYSSLLILLGLFAGGSKEFIYFQF